MSQIIKAFTGIIIIMFLILTTTGILGMFLESVAAQNLHSAMVTELENSNYAPMVFSECFACVEKNGYELELTLYSSEGGRTVCKESTDIPIDVSDVYMAEVVLNYDLRHPFLSIEHQEQIWGYAR